ncbi:Non-heme dioxygenase N-terminal domain-containing protein [Kalaharituber pfeilii]|nr:Non-heme dioxygenase N-terminal domain-containing protein [Kalaharituber pfeilii]
MSSTVESKNSLPIIDLTPFLPASTGSYKTPEDHLAAKLSTAAALNKACTDVGFFYLKGHGISETLRQAVLEESRNWFLTATEEDKEEIRRRDCGMGPGGTGDGARGYQQIGENFTGGMQDWQEVMLQYFPIYHP